MKRLLFLLLCATAFGQAVRYDLPPVLNSRGVPIANPQISLCTGLAVINGTTCSIQAQSVTDITGATLCAGGSPVTLANSNVCRATGDALGNAGFWLTPGAYIYCVTAPSTTGQCYNLTVPVGNTAAGVATITGALTAGSVNNVVKADQQTGADACAKIVTAMGLLPTAGGTVDATGFQGAQTCGSATALSKNGVTYLFPANATFTATAGITITISGNDVIFQGAGDTTKFDFSAGTSANNNFSVTGSRVTIQGINVNGNRIAGGTATCISLNPGSTQDRNTVQYSTIQNCGGVGIYSIKQTHLNEYKNTILSTGFSTMFHDPPQQFTRVDTNTVTDYNLSSTGGHGGIMFNGPNLTDQQDHIITHNIQQEATAGTNHVGIGVNGCFNCEVSFNRVLKSNGGGESIAVTGRHVRIIGNHSTLSGACGILYFANATFSTDFIIQGNIAEQSATSGICLVWGANNVTISDGIVTANRMKANTSFGFQTYNGASFTGMVIKNVTVAPNAWQGNTGGTFNLLTSGVTGNATLWGNTDTDNITDLVTEGGIRVLGGFVEIANGLDLIGFSDNLVTQKFHMTSATGLLTVYGGTSTAGQGVPPIYGATSQKAETQAADANVLTVTPPAVAGTYRVCTSISVSSATTGVISWTLSWTDSSGNAQANIAQQIFQMGTAAPNTTFTTSAAGNYYGCSTIDVNNAAASIVVKWVGGGTTAAKMSAAIERLQ